MATLGLCILFDIMDCKLVYEHQVGKLIFMIWQGMQEQAPINWKDFI